MPSAKKEGKNASALSDAMKGCLGSQQTPSEVKKWLIRNIMDNIGRKTKITLNIMSCPGVGKTSIVKSLADTPVDWNGKHYDGFAVVDIPLAQIEEMGDVLGYPVEEIKMLKYGEDEKGNPKVVDEKWIKAVDSLIAAYMEKGWTTDNEQRTIYAKPSWVPSEERPGVLLFDDGNRASQRILKGLMQLVQDYRTISWDIPDGWTIVFTGNPDNRFNQVTSMDTAQLSRMKFISMIPDNKEWALWAQNNDIDERLISYVLSYPEMMVGTQRTNPRSLAEFGRALKHYPTIDTDSYAQCEIEARASLDSATVESLMIFLTSEVELVLEPIQILTDYDKYGKKHIENLMKRKDPRLDIVAVINDRLYAYMVSDKYKFEEAHIKNFQNWLLDPNQPPDSAYALIRRLCYARKPFVGYLLADNERLMKLIEIGFGDNFNPADFAF